MKRIFFISLLIGTCFQISQAQIKVSSTNNVGIGVDNPLSKLSIGNSGNTISKVYIENSGTFDKSPLVRVINVSTFMVEIVVLLFVFLKFVPIIVM